MDSTRIFIKGLPPNIPEAEVRKHFGTAGYGVTDVRLVPGRRICYVGYKSRDEAADAVKYYNRSYLGRCKLIVEPAKSVSYSSVIMLTPWRTLTMLGVRRDLERPQEQEVDRGRAGHTHR